MGQLTIHVAEHGNGLERTAVLLHSSGQSGAQWRGYVEPLAEAGWRTLAVDLIGNGKSPAWAGPGRFELRHDVEQVVSLLGSLGEREHAIVGHSYGGFIGLQALRDPTTNAMGAVLFEPGAWGVLRSDGSDKEKAALKATAAEWFADDAKGDSEAWMKQFVEYWGGPGAWEFIGPTGRAGMMRSARKTYEEARGLSFDETPLASYKDLGVPVHLITGSHSPREIRSICRLLDGTSQMNALTEVSGGHMTPLLSPATVAPVVVAALDAIIDNAKGG